MIRLKKLRLQDGLSQQKMSDLLGVSRSTVAMWEIGASEPDNNTLGKIAEHFNVSVDYLLGLSDDPHQAISNDDVKNAIDEYVKNKGKQSTVIRYNGKEQTYETLDMTDEEWEIAQATIEALRLKRK